jgi:hypothetical protein
MWNRSENHLCLIYRNIFVSASVNCSVIHKVVEASWNVDRAQKPDFVFWRNGWVHLNWRGLQFNRQLAATVCASAVVMVGMLDTPCSEVVWRVLATHSICQFPLHFPSRASLCAIIFQLRSAHMLENACIQDSNCVGSQAQWSPAAFCICLWHFGRICWRQWTLKLNVWYLLSRLPSVSKEESVVTVLGPGALKSLMLCSHPESCLQKDTCSFH